MTRINIVPVETLTNEHLVAEYKEITRPFTKMWNRISKNKLNIRVPAKYKLGSGHETFFFDKLFWLYKRRAELSVEMRNRGMNVDMTKFTEIQRDIYDKFSHTNFWKDYKPSPEEMYLNMTRLVMRSAYDEIRDEIKANGWVWI